MVSILTRGILQHIQYLFGCDDVCTMYFNAKRLGQPSGGSRVIFSTVLTKTNKKKLPLSTADHTGRLHSRETSN